MEENQMLEKDFKEVFKDIKNEILNAQYDILKTGDEEYLITNLKELSYEEIFKIYGKRWNIETLYNSLKNKLQIEKFTSSKEEIIKQDVTR